MAMRRSRSARSPCRAPPQTVETGALRDMDDNLAKAAEGAGDELWKDGSPNLRLLQAIDVRLSVAVGARSEKRSVGKACVSTCRSRWSPYHSNKKALTIITKR